MPAKSMTECDDCVCKCMGREMCVGVCMPVDDNSNRHCAHPVAAAIFVCAVHVCTRDFASRPPPPMASTHDDRTVDRSRIAASCGSMPTSSARRAVWVMVTFTTSEGLICSSAASTLSGLLPAAVSTAAEPLDTIKVAVKWQLLVPPHTPQLRNQRALHSVKYRR